MELASYSMQAEFGNFDAERHTAHYLKDFQLFPKVKLHVTRVIYKDQRMKKKGRNYKRYILKCLVKCPIDNILEFYYISYQILDISIGRAVKGDHRGKFETPK